MHSLLRSSGPRPFVSALLFAAISLPLWSQTAPPASKYANEPLVLEKALDVIVVKADGTGSRQQTMAIRINTDAALRQLGVVSVQFAGASEHVVFHYVRARHKDGTVSETPAAGVIEQPMPVTKEAPFYSDLKEAQLPVRDLRVDDVLEWQYTVERTRAEAPNHSWGAENLAASTAVTLDENVELRAPKTLALQVWTNPRLKVQPAKTTEGDEVVWRWHSSQLKPTVGAEADAAKKALKDKAPTEDELTDEENGKLAGIEWTTFKDWGAVGEWYRSLAAKRADPDDEIRAKAKELTAGLKTDDEKARAIYAYVSAQIRYIGVAFGVGRFQPHEASDVLHNQYGDCKDKQTLLSALLNAAGIPSDAALIGANVRFNPEVPAPNAFNHMIAHLSLGGKDLWLDPTEEVAPPGMMFSMLRDKEALVIPPTGTPHLVKTVADMPFAAENTWVAKGKLSADGVTDSHITTTWRGDEELMFRSVLKSVPPSQYEDIAQKFANNYGYSGTTSHAEMGRPDDTGKALLIGFDYHRDKSGDWDNLRILPEVLPIYLPRVDASDPPTRPLKLGTPGVSRASSELALPAGWTVELPEAIHAKARWATYDQTYRFESGVLYSERVVKILEPKVPASEWKAYKKWQDDADLGFDRYVKLYRPRGDGKAFAAGAASGHVTSDEVDGKIQKAFDAEQKLDVKTAEEQLKQAKEADPQARRLWMAYGWLAMARGKNNEAVEDFRKELALYPRETPVYGMIAQAQWAKDHAEAIMTMRQYVAADPGSSDAWGQLAGMLYTDKQYAEAAKAAAKNVELAPPGTEAQKLEGRKELLGNSLLKSGQTAEGEKVMLALLKDTDTPGTMNDAAYALADAKLDLPLDDEKVRAALARMDAETQAWTLDENPATLRQKSSLLAATWDTMGWILFREGKLAEARTFILAAYMNEHHEEVRGHLDEIDTQLKQPHLASGKKTDQEDRTFALGHYTGPRVVAEYRLLLSEGKVERDEPVGRNAVGGADGMLKTTDFSKLFPAGSHAKLVRTGMVNCGGGKCDIVLEP